MELKTERVSPVEDDFFLNPDFAFGNDEKVQYFDVLKSKYLTMLKTYDEVERQLGCLEGEVKWEEKVKVYKRVRAKKSLPGLDITNARYEETKEDPSVPDGWKCA